MNTVNDQDLDLMRAQADWQRRYLEQTPPDDATPTELLQWFLVYFDGERRQEVRAVGLEVTRRLYARELQRAAA